MSLMFRIRVKSYSIVNFLAFVNFRKKPGILLRSPRFSVSHTYDITFPATFGMPNRILKSPSKKLSLSLSLFFFSAFR